MGLDSARMLGRTWQELGWDPEYATRFQGMLRLALTTGQLIEDAREVSTARGLMHHEYVFAPLRGQPGLPHVRRLDNVVVDADDLRQLHGVSLI